MPGNDMQSPVWQYFIKMSNDLSKTQCTICKNTFTYSRGSTGAMITHLKTIHRIVLKNSVTSESNETLLWQKKPKTIMDFVKKDSLEVTVSKLAAIDGFSIRGITRSSFIRDSMNFRGFKLPKNETDVMKLILTDYANKKGELKNKLQNAISAGEKFSLTMDEWTSTKMRRYFNINLHDASGKFNNLGLARINGSCNSEKIQQVVRNHLLQFGISFDRDIVACTTDGAAVNVKFGGESPTEFQLCLAHGAHLAVMDVICDKRDSEEEFCGADIGSDCSEESENDDDCFIEDEENNIVCSQRRNLNPNLHQNLESLRKIVKFFRNSTVRNNILQGHVKKMYNHELELLLDCNTRWNSIVPMIERALLLKECIFDSSKDLGASHLFNAVDFELLEKLKAALVLIKLTVDAFCRSDANIIQAEGAINFLYTKLEELDTEISRKLLVSMQNRIEHRRNKNLINLAKFILIPTIQPSKQILSYASEMLKRLYTENSENAEISTDIEKLDEEDDDCIENPAEFSLKDELNLAIEKALLEPEPKCDFDLLKQEFALYKRTNNKTKNITLLYNAIKTIKPTSTESERAFSIAANFCTKIRSRLSDSSLNALTFLKFHYLNNK